MSCGGHELTQKFFSSQLVNLCLMPCDLGFGLAFWNTSGLPQLAVPSRTHVCLPSRARR